jgi:hypothetical protein
MAPEGTIAHASVSHQSDPGAWTASIAKVQVQQGRWHGEGAMGAIIAPFETRA